jgi:hypothetical protein
MRTVALQLGRYEGSLAGAVDAVSVRLPRAAFPVRSLSVTNPPEGISLIAMYTKTLPRSPLVFRWDQVTLIETSGEHEGYALGSDEVTSTVPSGAA